MKLRKGGAYITRNTREIFFWLEGMMLDLIEQKKKKSITSFHKIEKSIISSGYGILVINIRITR